jgi:ParB/RepB/Spo0J family partition protein
MPKLEAGSLTQKIGLDQIIDTGNIRAIEKYGPNSKGEFPKEIIELAESIKSIGQLQPVILKEAGEKDGVKQFELIAGFRRRAAYQYLVSIGLDYNRIDALIKTGDKLTIQLVENIQREDLTAPEREAAIFQLAENGMKQVEIAAQLSKDKGYVSKNISAYKTRQIAEREGIDLSGVETSTLAEFMSLTGDDLISALHDLENMGGTRASATLIAKKYKKEKDLPPPDVAPVSVNPSGATAAPPEPVEGDIDPLMAGGEIPAEPEPAKPAGTKPPQPKPEPIEADHRIIDVNTVLTVIYKYIQDRKKVNDIEKQTAAEELLALIHKELDNA